MSWKVRKIAMKKLVRDEKGRAMLVTLILLVFGSLILTPLLGLMSSGLVAGQVYEKKTDELYAADAGVEYAIWHLQQGGGTDATLELTLNGKNVTVQIDELPHECYESAVYEIISTATSVDGSRTSVTADVTNITVYYEGDKELYSGEKLEGNVYVEWNLTLNSGANITGSAMAGGDVILNACSVIGGTVCVGGDLTLNDGATVQSDVYVEGNVLLMGGSQSSWIEGDVYARENVTVDGSCQIRGVVWAGGDSVEVAHNAEITGDVHVRESATVSGNTGTVYRDYNDDWGCPLAYGDPEILLWLITG
jgi:cytoskeletal protein CcmA (bactofilin family)